MAHSQPSVLGAAFALQSARNVLHVYAHVVPLHVGVPVVVSHVLPHALQFVMDDSDVSHPLVSGGVRSQSSQPCAQPEYWQSPDEHVGLMLCPDVTSHAWPHAPQLAGVERLVSQPSVSGGVVLQSAHPEAHPWLYVQVVPEQVAPRLCTVSHDWPQTPQFMAVTGDSQPFVSASPLSQSAYPGAQPP